MTIEEYTNKVQDLLKKANGSVSGLKLSKEENIRMNISIINGNPTLVICEVDKDLNPIKILYCLELADIVTVRAMQVWLSDAMSLLAHDQLQKTDIENLTAETKE